MARQIQQCRRLRHWRFPTSLTISYSYASFHCYYFLGKQFVTTMELPYSYDGKIHTPIPSGKTTTTNKNEFVLTKQSQNISIKREICSWLYRSNWIQQRRRLFTSPVLSYQPPRCLCRVLRHQTIINIFLFLK